MRSLTLLLAAIVCSLPAQCDVIIDTFSQVNVGGIGPFPSFPTWGQVVTAPGGTNLLSSFSFQFYITNPGPNDMSFYPYVMAWDGTEATGPVLYRGPLTFTGVSGGVQQFDFTSNVAVTPGSQYVLFISTDETTINTPRSVYFEYTPSSAYAGGTLVFEQTGPASNFTSPWNTNTSEDLAFRADFANVPEPATAGLLCAGLGGLLWAAARKR